MSDRPALRRRIGLGELGHVEYDALGELAELSGVTVPEKVAVTLPGDSESPSLEMTLAVVGGVPTCRVVTLAAKEGERGVRSGDLSGVRLEDWIEDIFAVVELHEDPDGTRTWSARTLDEISAAARAVRSARRGAKRKITDAQLAEVAEVYKRHADSAPTQAVADHFAVSHRTASGYATRAREAGHLPPTTRGRTGI